MTYDPSKGLYGSPQSLFNNHVIELNNQNTLKIVRAGLIPGQDSDGTYYGCFNLIGGFSLTLQTATFATGQWVRVINTGLANAATLVADNGSAFTGDSTGLTLLIPSGTQTAYYIQWNGSNFVVSIVDCSD
jgi:hypothetical protein